MRSHDTMRLLGVFGSVLAVGCTNDLPAAFLHQSQATGQDAAAPEPVHGDAGTQPGVRPKLAPPGVNMAPEKDNDGAQRAPDAGTTAEPPGDAGRKPVTVDAGKEVPAEMDAGEALACELDSCCADGMLNGDESDVDCGGEYCEACGAGAVCNLPADCFNESCIEGRCELAAVGAECRTSEDCISGSCIAQQCTVGGLGAACAVETDCASSRCVNQSCAELDLSITSEGAEEQTLLFVHFVVAAGSVRVNWDELAILYFFVPEAVNDFHTVWESDPEADQMCVALGDDQWAYVWRNSARGPVSASPTGYYSQVHDESWQPMINANDYSFVEAAGPNTKVAVCRRVDGRWYHVQGGYPPGVTQPCAQVEPDCSEVVCDDPSD